MSEKILYGGLELGGTTIKVCLAENQVTNVIYQQTFPTTTPQETLQKALDFFRQHKIVALGIGSFGPVDVHPTSPTYGYITTTPKPYWTDAPIVSFFSSLNVPIHFNTDVNAAALGELEWGGHEKRLGSAVSNVMYVTVGTGIGGGVVVDGKAVSGALHPECGHFRVPRHPKDNYQGNCPFHKDCLEGLANAAAVAARCNVHPSKLHTVPDSHPVWAIEAFYLAHLCVTFACIVSPHVIVLGGGVLKRTCLFPLIRQQFLSLMNGYLRVDRMTSGVNDYIVGSIFEAAGSKTSAGCVGVLELARRAWEEKQGQIQHKKSSAL